jgi:predicted transcriptional regulator
MPKKLSKAELFYIAENPDNQTPEELAKELGFAVSVIKKYFKPKEQPPQIEKPHKSVIKVDLAKRIKNGEVIATVMTPGASEQSDEIRRERGTTKETIKNAVHRCKTGS